LGRRNNVQCLTEFTLSVYADGELPEVESRDVMEHLALCSSCASRVAAFREESHFLTHSFQDVDTLESELEWMPVPEQAPGPAQVAKLGMVVVGVAVGLRIAHALSTGFEMPKAPDWLNPSSLSGQVNLLAGMLAYVWGEGLTMMSSLVGSWSVVALFATVLFGVAALLRRTATANAVLMMTLALVFVVGFSTPGEATDVRHSQGTITVAKSETIDDTLFATGDIVTVDGNVNGDVIAFGRQVNVTGNVSGNVLACGQRIEVTGAVGGTVIQCGQSIGMSGKVGHDLYGFGQTLKLSKDSSVGGNASLFGADSAIDGNVARDVHFSGGFLTATGNVGRNVVMQGGSVILSSPAHVGGNLTARVPRKENVRVDAGAVVAGKQVIQLPEPVPSPYATAGFYFRQILWIAAALVTGLVLFRLFPGLRGPNLGNGQSLLKSGAIGFLATFATPIAVLVIGITIVGLPIALAGLAAWIISLYLAKIVVAEFIGRALLGPGKNNLSATALALLVGLLPIAVAVELPFVGGLLNILLVLIGFGAMLMAAWQKQTA
jgi:hypothetical protein